MSLTNEQFLKVLEGSQLLPPEALATLRALATEAGGEAQPRHLAKWTVDNGHLTPFQAKELLAGRWKSEGKPPARPAAKAVDDLAILDDDLEVVEDEPSRAASVTPSADDELEVVEEEDLTPLKGQPTFRGGPRRPPRPPAAPAPRAPQPEPARASYDPMLAAAGPMAPAGTTMAPAGPAITPPRVVHPRLVPMRKRGPSGSIWDSKLLFTTGALLLLLLLGGGFLLWRVTTITGDELLRQADEDYERQNYVNAINKLEKYIAENPNHERISYGRVRRGLASMRQVVDPGTDWPKALEVTETVLAQIEGEKEFPSGQGELAAMLPKIAEGLANQARLAPAETLVEQAREALALIAKYVPKSQRPVELVRDVEASLGLTVRSLERSGKLRAALDEIRKATSAGDTGRAYDARDALLSTYPDLSENAELQDAILAASQAERSQVKFDDTPHPAMEGDEQPAMASTIVLAGTTGGPAAGVEGQTVYALVEGAAYGLDAGSGRVLWRRFVGFDTDFVPLPVGAVGSGDALLVDSRDHELVRVDGKTGDVRWRHRIGEPLAGGPVPLRSTVLVATRSGKVRQIKADDGAATGTIVLPQPLRVAPAAEPRQRKAQPAYQVGEHSNLYVISADGTACEEVLYLGHDKGSIVVPPVVLSRYVIIAENVGLDSGFLRVLVTDEKGLGARQVQRVALDGHIHAPLLVTSKELLAITDRGALYTFEAKTPDDPQLMPVAQKAAADQVNLARYVLVAGSQFWIADNQLARYDLQAANAQLSAQWVKHAGEVFLQRPWQAGEFVFHVRRRPGLPGATVAASNAADGLAVWETRLAAPVAGHPQVREGGKLLAMTADASMFEVSADAGAAAASVASLPTAKALPADAGPAVCTDGVLAYGGKETGDRLAVYDPQSSLGPLHWLTLPDKAAGPPASLYGRVLVPGLVGQLLLVDPRSGQNIAEPFLPPIEADSPPVWQGLAALSDKEALVSDGHKLYRIGVDREPRPHLAALAEGELEEPLASAIAVLDSVAFAVDAAGRVRAFGLPDLAPVPVRQGSAEVQIGGRVAWGPRRVGPLVLLAVEDEEIVALDRQGQVAWRGPLPYGPLASAAADGDATLVLASTHGTVWTAAAEDGRELHKVEIGQPLGTGIVAAGGNWVVPGQDGTLHLVPKNALSPGP
jgi:outer membrane protein assembly factor BamB